MEEIKVLLPIKNIPIGSIVTKRTGEKRYHMSNVLRIFNEEGERSEIHTGYNMYYLFSNSSNNAINVVSGDTEHLWVTNTQDLLEYLTNRI